MNTYKICDVCDQPIDLCDCRECWCGKKIQAHVTYCSKDCETEALDDHIRGQDTEGGGYNVN